MKRTLILAIVAAASLIVASCTNDPGPPTSSTWSSHGFVRTDNASIRENHIGAWTNNDWFASIALTAPKDVNGEIGISAASLRIAPRTGPSNKNLGVAQTIPLTSLSGPFNAIHGESFIGLSETGGVQFYTESGGTWSPNGFIATPEHAVLTGLNDNWMTVRQGSTDGESDSTILVYDVSLGAGGVTGTLNTTLTPDPTWPIEQRAVFGNNANLDGDLLAVMIGDFDTSPGRVQVFEANGTWGLSHEISNVPGDPIYNGRISVDDSPSGTDRFAFTRRGATDTFVEVHADSGAGWALEQSIYAPALPDADNGNNFATAVGIDGDRMAIGSRSKEIANPTSDTGVTKVGMVEIYNFDTSWIRETSLTPSTNPPSDFIRTAYASDIQVVNNHVAVTMISQPVPPPDCGFFCFFLGFEAWTFSKG